AACPGWLRRDRAHGDPRRHRSAAARARGAEAPVLRALTAAQRKGPPFGGPFRPCERGRLARLARRHERPRRDDLPRDELTAPGLATLESIGVPTVVRADREEADDDHAERHTRHQPDREKQHGYPS